MSAYNKLFKVITQHTIRNLSWNNCCCCFQLMLSESESWIIQLICKCNPKKSKRDSICIVLYTNGLDIYDCQPKYILPATETPLVPTSSTLVQTRKLTHTISPIHPSIHRVGASEHFLSPFFCRRRRRRRVCFVLVFVCVCEWVRLLVCAPSV